MALSKSASLVLNAERSRRRVLAEALSSHRKGISLEDVSGYLQTFGPCARELHYVNQHITVPQAEIDAAADAYSAVAHHLLEELHWPDEAITVLPQGSASTQTLIRSTDRSKFDIDAVCQVDINRLDARYPVEFFNTVGNALRRKFAAIPKNRCWTINSAGETFYLEFTPSVPLEKVPQHILSSMAPRFLPAGQRLGTALAVVDNRTKAWKTSNPAGFTKWVDETAQLVLLRQIVMEAASMRKSANVAPVPDQDVDITDTLRVAIRLFKRHRDMCVDRQVFEKDVKPISVIIVTLLTTCYAGLAELGQTYDHPVQLLAELAELMPGMVAMENGQYRVDNPTGPGENFAERWNDDQGERRDAFFLWCDKLAGDMRTILAAEGTDEIRRQVRTVFGCGADRSSAGGSGGMGYTSPARRPPSPPPSTPGLA